MSGIEKARSEINAIDMQMAQLFEKRMAAAKQVAEYKKEHSLPVFDKAREDAVIAQNSQYITDSDIRNHYVSFISSVMNISKTYQRSLLRGSKVAYSGVEGAFAYISAKEHFPDYAPVSYSDFEAAYKACENGECDCAVLPIENSLGGDVGLVMDLAFFGPLYINDVFEKQVTQNLLCVKGASLADIKTVISHPQALSQCKGFIEKHGFEQKECVNTAVAAKMVMESGDKTVAAIASEDAAEKYSLEILRSHIQDGEGNTTRFAVFSRAPKTESVFDNRFIMMFTVKNEPGSLARAVSAIGENGFNLHALKSRPTKHSNWCYYFYVEGEGSVNSFDGRRMLKELEPHCLSLKIIGSYKE